MCGQVGWVTGSNFIRVTFTPTVRQSTPLICRTWFSGDHLTSLLYWLCKPFIAAYCRGFRRYGLCICVQLLSCVRLFATPWTAAHQPPPSMGFSRQEYKSWLLFPSPGDLPYPWIKPSSLKNCFCPLLSNFSYKTAGGIWETFPIEPFPLTPSLIWLVLLLMWSLCF